MFMAVGIFMLAKFKTSDRIYTPLPLYHTAGGVMSIGAALLHGATVVIKRKFSASAYFMDCIKYKCTVSFLYLFQLLLKDNTYSNFTAIFIQEIILEKIQMWKEMDLNNF